jgi:predicted metal-dependent phosphoesterase TrpH
MKLKSVLGVSLVLLTGLAAVAADPRQEIHFPDLPGYQTLKCDFHMHTVFSDGEVWPTVRVDEAWREGLDVIAITDHIEYQPHRNDVTTNHDRPYELAASRAHELNIVLIRGAEITRDTPPGHHNALFLSDVDALDTKDFYDVFDQAAKQDAFCFWNHPGWRGREVGKWSEQQQKLVDKHQLHGIEICNGGSYYEYAHQYALDKGLTIVGDSDIHRPSTGLRDFDSQHRTLTLVFARERTVAGVRDALFAGRTAVWFEDQLIGPEPELSQMFANSVQVCPPHHQNGKRTWVAIRNGCELNIELERVGDKGPRNIRLPALRTTLVRFDVPIGELAGGLVYQTGSFLVGPNQPLRVKLVVPPPAGQGREAAAAAHAAPVGGK